MLWNLGSLVVNYPYDDDKKGLSQYSQSPDDKVFQQVSRAYSQVNGHRMSAGLNNVSLWFHGVTENKIRADKSHWLFVKSVMK